MNTKLIQKWNPVMEKLGVTDASKKEWLAEYAENHQIYENVGFSTLGNHTGMGAVVSAQPSAIPGQTGYGTGIAGQSYGQGGTVGSGDYGQQLLPVSMKIAAQTIGLDLVSVKPSPGPVIDLMFVDYRYDDGNVNKTNYKPLIFKTVGVGVEGKESVKLFTTQVKAIMSSLGVRETVGGLTHRMFFNLAENTDPARIQGAVGTGLADVLVEPTVKTGVVEFLGFSFIDKAPMFRSYRTTNTTPQGIWDFEVDKNTFAKTEVVADAFNLSGDDILTDNIVAFGSEQGTSGVTGEVTIELISTMEDNIPGFVSNFTEYGMPRDMDDDTYPTAIGPNVTVKRVQVGTEEVSSALKLSEIEDIKAQTGIDIVQKMESVLINELSQKISKQIVKKVFDMGELNRQSAPGYATGTTQYDFDVDAYLATNAPGGETSQSLQRKLITKLRSASNYIFTQGRVGRATYIVTNGDIAAALLEGSNYTLNPVVNSVSAEGQLYPAGKIDNMTVYVDPYQLSGDNRILIGRKNNPDQPGVIFVPYLMAQTINLISEASKGAPRIFIRSRYAVTEVGFFPQKQYMVINVKDTYNRLT